jgi:uncharacterized protein (DUF1697 family)
MAGLRAALDNLGLEDVVTYVQSGNVVFRAPKRSERTIAASIERRVADEFGVQSRVLIRTPLELAAIAAGNPFLAESADPAKLHVVFLSAVPAKARAAALDPDRAPPAEHRLVGRELYLHLPEGAGASKLSLDWVERTLGVDGTQRNWRTVLKLLELSGS